MVRQRNRFLVTNVASRNDSKIGSDHKLVVMHMRISKPCHTRAVRPPRKFDAQAVASTEECATFEQLVSEIDISEESDPDAAYEAFVNGYHSS